MLRQWNRHACESSRATAFWSLLTEKSDFAVYSADSQRTKDRRGLVVADRAVQIEPDVRGRAGVLVFYAVFLLLLVAEGAIVAAVLAGTRWMGVAALGPWASWLLFIAGGIVLGMFELRSITTDQKMKDPILRACCWLQRRFGAMGFVINAAVIGGSPGAAVALKQTGIERQTELTVFAAVLFASVWVPLFVFLWR